MRKVSYSMPRYWTAFLLAFFILFTLVATYLIAIMLSGQKNAPPVLFGVAWIGAFLWNAYWWLYRISVGVDVENGRFHWRGALRHGEFVLSDLVSIGPSRITKQIVSFKFANGKNVLMQVRPGLLEFSSALAEQLPMLAAAPSESYERFGRSPSGQNGFTRED